MDKKDIGALGCAGLILGEAVVFSFTGEKPPLPAGQPHIHVPVLTGNMGALSYPVTITTSSLNGMVSSETPLS